MPGLSELKQKFGALEARLAPLDAKDTGVVGMLKALSGAGDRLAAAIARLEQDEGAGLAQRIRELSETKRELEERIASLFAQFSAIESIHKDINGLFAKLSQAQRPRRGVEGVTPLNVLPSAQAG
jgi:chromosome segregation ATPase